MSARRALNYSSFAPYSNGLLKRISLFSAVKSRVIVFHFSALEASAQTPSGPSRSNVISNGFRQSMPMVQPMSKSENIVSFGDIFAFFSPESFTDDVFNHKYTLSTFVCLAWPKINARDDKMTTKNNNENNL